MSLGGKRLMNFVFINGGMHFSVYSFIVSFISQKIKRGRNDSSHFSFIFVNAFGFVGKNVKLLTLIFQKIKQLFVGGWRFRKDIFLCLSAIPVSFLSCSKDAPHLETECLRGITIFKVCIFYFKYRLKE